MKDKKQKSAQVEAEHQNGVCGKAANGVYTNGHGTNCEFEPENKARNRRPFLVQPQAAGDSDSDSTEAPTASEPLPSRGALFLDPANLCTLTGAVLAALAMAAMWKGSYALGITLNMAASLGDILDGPIARSLPKRHPTFSVMGAKLDTYSDMVSHFVVPASLLMQISEMDMLYVGLATIWVITGIVRQSYFEVIERCDDGACIFGVTSDYMVPLCAMSLHLVPILGKGNIANYVVPALAVCILSMIYASLTFSLKSRRYTGFGLFTVSFFNVSLCMSCFLMYLWGSFNVETPLGIWSFEGLSLIYHLILAYPCYYRFVEINW